MKCTTCSHKIKPVVVLDIDGTLADYHTEFTAFCEKYFDTWQRYEWNGGGDFEDYLGLSRNQYREAKLAYRQGGYKRWLPLYPGVRDLFDDLSVYPVEIWICTTRPWQRLDNIDPDTQEWLHRNHLNVDGLLYGDDKYRQLVDRVDQRRVAACVEDLPEQFDNAHDLGLPVIQIERQHNSGFGLSRVPRGNMQVVRAWVSDRVEKWNVDNDRSDS